jgi:hypothetical protein
VDHQLTRFKEKLLPIFNDDAEQVQAIEIEGSAKDDYADFHFHAILLDSEPLLKLLLQKARCLNALDIGETLPIIWLFTPEMTAVHYRCRKISSSDDYIRLLKDHLSSGLWPGWTAADKVVLARRCFEAMNRACRLFLHYVDLCTNVKTYSAQNRSLLNDALEGFRDTIVQLWRQMKPGYFRAPGQSNTEWKFYTEISETHLVRPLSYRYKTMPLWLADRVADEAYAHGHITDWTRKGRDPKKEFPSTL